MTTDSDSGDGHDVSRETTNEDPVGDTSVVPVDGPGMPVLTTSPEGPMDAAARDVSRETRGELGGDELVGPASDGTDASRETRGERGGSEGGGSEGGGYDADGPASEGGNVSRETTDARLGGGVSSPEPVDVSRETSTTFDTPIMREAASAVRTLNIRKEEWPRPAATRVMAVANQKGGVGKTTSTVNIAAALALHGLEVLVIDLDPQGNASTALGVDHSVGTPSAYDVLLGGRPIADVLGGTEISESLHCVPATLDLAGADIELTSQVAREHRLERAVHEYLDAAGDRRPDYILIDCPPSLGLLTLNALVAAREMLIPIQCEYYALEGLAQLLNTVELVRAHLNPPLAVSTVLLTMYDARTRLADQVADEVRRHFGPLVLGPVIPRNVRVSEAPGFGQTVITYDPGSRGATSYLQAAHELAERGADSSGSSTGAGPERTGE